MAAAWRSSPRMAAIVVRDRQSVDPNLKLTRELTRRREGGRVERLVMRPIGNDAPGVKSQVPDSTISLIVARTPDQNSSERARLVSSGMLSSVTDRTTPGLPDSMRKVQVR